MNARFRIGNTYEFKRKSAKFFISEQPLEYLGYCKYNKEYVFSIKGTGTCGIYRQRLPKKYLGYVAVKTEWDK